MEESEKSELNKLREEDSLVSNRLQLLLHEMNTIENRLSSIRGGDCVSDSEIDFNKAPDSDTESCASDTGTVIFMSRNNSRRFSKRMRSTRRLPKQDDTIIEDALKKFEFGVLGRSFDVLDEYRQTVGSFQKQLEAVGEPCKPPEEREVPSTSTCLQESDDVQKPLEDYRSRFASTSSLCSVRTDISEGRRLVTTEYEEDDFTVEDVEVYSISDRLSPYQSVLDRFSLGAGRAWDPSSFDDIGNVADDDDDDDERDVNPIGDVADDDVEVVGFVADDVASSFPIPEDVIRGAPPKVPVDEPPEIPVVTNLDLVAVSKQDILDDIARYSKSLRSSNVVQSLSLAPEVAYTVFVPDVLKTVKSEDYDVINEEEVVPDKVQEEGYEVVSDLASGFLPNLDIIKEEEEEVPKVLPITHRTLASDGITPVVNVAGRRDDVARPLPDPNYDVIHYWRPSDHVTETPRYVADATLASRIAFFESKPLVRQESTYKPYDIIPSQSSESSSIETTFKESRSDVIKDSRSLFETIFSPIGSECNVEDPLARSTTFDLHLTNDVRRAETSYILRDRREPIETTFDVTIVPQKTVESTPYVHGKDVADSRPKIRDVPIVRIPQSSSEAVSSSRIDLETIFKPLESTFDVNKEGSNLSNNDVAVSRSDQETIFKQVGPSDDVAELQPPSTSKLMIVSSRQTPFWSPHRLEFATVVPSPGIPLLPEPGIPLTPINETNIDEAYELKFGPCKKPFVRDDPRRESVRMSRRSGRKLKPFDPKVDFDIRFREKRSFFEGVRLPLIGSTKRTTTTFK